MNYQEMGLASLKVHQALSGPEDVERLRIIAEEIEKREAAARWKQANDLVTARMIK